MDDIIDFWVETNEDIDKHYHKLFLTFKETLNLSDEDAYTAVNIAIGTCRHCWEYDITCQCWNDI